MARKARTCLPPGRPQQVLATEPALFGLVRTAPDGASRVLCLHNVSGQPRTFVAGLSSYGFHPGAPLTDLLTGEIHYLDGRRLGQLPRSRLWRALAPPAVIPIGRVPVN